MATVSTSTAGEGGSIGPESSQVPAGPPLEAEDLERSRQAGGGLRIAFAFAAVVGFVGLVFLLYAAAIHANSGDSDGASVILEGQTIAHGHFLLHGWALSLDSFWTVDALFYAVAILLGGLRPGLLYAVPALLAALVILAGVLMAREGRRGVAAVAAGATAFVLLAFPTHAMAMFFLRGPLHIGTTLWGLIAFACLRKGRFGWGWVVAVVFLAAGALGDLQILVLAVAPIFLGGIVAMLRTRTWRGGIAQVTAAASGLVLAEIVRTVAKALGTFSIGAANPTSLHLIFSNLRHAASLGAELTGVRSTLFGTGGVPTPLQDVHIVGGVVMVAAFVAALVMLVRDALVGRQRDAAGAVPAGQAPRYRVSDASLAPALWRIDDMLVIAMIGVPIDYGALALSPGDLEYARYLAPALIFAAILAGRMVARAVTTLRARSAALHTSVSRTGAAALVGRAVGVVGVAVSLCFAAGLGYNLAQPDPGQPGAQLASFLETHHLTNGVGSYWAASIITVESRGKVTIRPVVAGSGSQIRRYPRESDAAWYSGQRFQFFVYNLAIPWGSDNSTSATATWGRPMRTYAVGTFRVLVWPKPLVVGPGPVT
jgi:hypothetical protein